MSNETKSLEELAQPVAYTDAEELRFPHATSDIWPVPLGFGKDVPLYSQEYVDALQHRIAELERANNEMQRMELTEQITAEALTEHIARLAQSLTDEKKKSAALERDCGIYDNTVKELQERAGSAETRIAELEGMEQTLNVANDATRIWKERAEAAEAKLATPVRLPQLCGDGDNDTEYTEGLNDGITQSAIYLRRQGFKVEGDA